MTRRRKLAWLLSNLRPLLASVFVLFLMLFGAGCKSKNHTSDPHLKKIDEMLSAQLPAGTQRARVEYFLKSRGYNLENSRDKNSVVAVVRHIDTETLRPTTARVTFHFDSNDKLRTYELQPAPNDPFQP